MEFPQLARYVFEEGFQIFQWTHTLQCPIAPGSSFTYTFQADLYGSSWYHSHYSAQYAGGAEGPMVIYGPKTQPYDIDLGPVFITDYYHDVSSLSSHANQGIFNPFSGGYTLQILHHLTLSKTCSCLENVSLIRYVY